GTEMGFENIDVAISVEIADPETHSSLLAAILIQRNTAFQAALGEGAIAIVSEQQAGRRVARDVNIRPAVPVEIGGSRGERVIRLDRQDTGGLAHVSKRPVSVVVVQT